MVFAVPAAPAGGQNENSPVCVSDADRETIERIREDLSADDPEGASAAADELLGLVGGGLRGGAPRDKGGEPFLDDLGVD